MHIFSKQNGSTVISAPPIFGEELLQHIFSRETLMHIFNRGPPRFFFSDPPPPFLFSFFSNFLDERVYFSNEQSPRVVAVSEELCLETIEK